jgi:hypothetical protein
MYLVSPRPRRCERFRNTLIFHGEEFLIPFPHPKLEGHPLSDIRVWLFNIFAAILPNLSSWRTISFPRRTLMYAVSSLCRLLLFLQSSKPQWGLYISAVVDSSQMYKCRRKKLKHCPHSDRGGEGGSPTPITRRTKPVEARRNVAYSRQVNGYVSHGQGPLMIRVAEHPKCRVSSYVECISLDSCEARRVLSVL